MKYLRGLTRVAFLLALSGAVVYPAPPTRADSAPPLDSYACNLLRYFAYSKIRNIDLTEVEFWTNQISYQFRELGDDDLASKVSEKGQASFVRVQKSGESFRILRGGAFVSLAVDHCGGCMLQDTYPELAVTECADSMVAVSSTLPAGANPNPVQPPSGSGPATAPPVSTPSTGQPIDIATKEFGPYLSRNYGSISQSMVLQVGGQICGLAVSAGYVTTFERSGAWTQVTSSDLPGQIKSVDQSSVPGMQGPTLLVRWDNGGTTFGSVLRYAGNCGWAKTPIVLSGMSFTVLGLENLRVSGGQVVGTNSGATVVLAYDQSNKWLREV